MKRIAVIHISIGPVPAPAAAKRRTWFKAVADDVKSGKQGTACGWTWATAALEATKQLIFQILP